MDMPAVDQLQQLISRPTSPWWDGLPAMVLDELNLADVHELAGHDLADIDVVIVGAGIAGLSAAAASAEAGAKTLVLEKAPKIGYGATGRNAGILSAGINTPLGSLPQGSPGALLWDRTVHVASELLAEAARPNSLLQARRTGALSLAKSAAAAKRLAREKRVLQAHGFQSELLTPFEIGQLTAPHLDLHEVECALLLPDDGRIQPLTLLAWMAHRARKAGAILAGNARVIKSTGPSKPSEEWSLLLSDGLSVTASSLIRAIGPTHTPTLRIYAMAFEADLPEDFPLFWDANPYCYYDYRAGDGRLVTTGGRYAKAGATAGDDKYYKGVAEAAHKWLPSLRQSEPIYKWAVDLHVAPELIPSIRNLPGGHALSIEGLGSLGVLPGIVLGRQAGESLAAASKRKLSV